MNDGVSRQVNDLEDGGPSLGDKPALGLHTHPRYDLTRSRGRPRTAHHSRWCVGVRRVVGLGDPVSDTRIVANGACSRSIPHNHDEQLYPLDTEKKCACR